MNRIRSRLAPLAALMALLLALAGCSAAPSTEEPGTASQTKYATGKYTQTEVTPAVDSGFAPAKLQMLDGVPTLSLYNDAQNTAAAFSWTGDGWETIDPSTVQAFLDGAGQNAGGNADRLLRRQRPVVGGRRRDRRRVDALPRRFAGKRPHSVDGYAACRRHRALHHRLCRRPGVCGRLPGGRRRKLCSADCGRAERGYFRHDPSQRCGLYLCGIGQPAVSAQPECRNDGCLCASFR